MERLLNKNQDIYIYALWPVVNKLININISLLTITNVPYGCKMLLIGETVWIYRWSLFYFYNFSAVDHNKKLRRDLNNSANVKLFFKNVYLKTHYVLN